MGRKTASLPPAYFEGLYAADPDPWRFATSDYERDKYEATLAALPRERYGRALEVGCSIGVLTAQLAPRCDALLSVDVVEEALAGARERCRGLPQVIFERMRLPERLPEGSFDLVLLSEVAYYWERDDLARVARWLATGGLAPGGDLVMVHWTGETDYPLSGDEAATLLLAALGGAVEPLGGDLSERYRLDKARLRPA